MDTLSGDSTSNYLPLYEASTWAHTHARKHAILNALRRQHFFAVGALGPDPDADLSSDEEVGFNEKGGPSAKKKKKKERLPKVHTLAD